MLNQDAKIPSCVPIPGLPSTGVIIFSECFFLQLSSLLTPECLIVLLLLDPFFLVP